MKNPFITNFVSEMQGRYGMLEHGLSNADWIQKNTKINGVNFSVHDHEFQEKIMNDQATHQVIKKCSQVGLTEIVVRVALAFLVRNQGTTTIMTQPTRTMALNFSTTRVQDIIEESPLIRNLLDRKVDSKELKALGKSYLYIKGTKGSSSAISVPADMILTDEYDFSDLAVVGKYNSRLSHSKYKLIKRFSTPTIPNFAISKEFAQSTQQHYLMKCPHCNHWNEHDFFTDVVVLHPKYKDVRPEDINIDDLVDIGPDQVQMLCQKCRRPLQYHDYTAREWVAKHPSRYISGYQVRPWNTATQRPFDLLRSREDYELYSDWVNFGLGEDYIDANQIFDINKIVEAKIGLGMPIFIGIDFGKDCWVVTGYKEYDTNRVIVNRKVKVSEHKVKDYIEEIIRNEFVVGMILDALPQTKLSADIRDLLPNAAYTAYYSDNQKDYYQIKGNEEDITISRTQLFDKVLSIKELVVQADENTDLYKEHMQGMVKQRLKDDVIESERYVKVKADHWLHATGYMYCAIDVFEGSSAHFAMPTVTTTKIQ